MAIYRAFPHGNSVGKARRGASEVSVWLSTALSLPARCVGKARWDASEVSVRPSTALSLHGNSVGKARQDASEVSVRPSTALSLHGRCIGKARRDASEVSVWLSTALSLHGSQPPRKTIPLRKPPPASLSASPPSKDPAEGFVDFFFGLVGVDAEVGVAGQHRGELGLAAVVEDVAGLAELFGVGEFISHSQ